jgi:hypothetical protein
MAFWLVDDRERSGNPSLSMGLGKADVDLSPGSTIA